MSLMGFRKVTGSAGAIEFDEVVVVLQMGPTNFFIGPESGSLNVSGDNNIGFGLQALIGLTGGDNNTALGVRALQAASLDNNNTAVGFESGNACIASGNTFIGFRAGLSATLGTANTCLGFQAGVNLGTGSNNIMIGNEGDALDTDVIRIGDGASQVCYVEAVNNNNALNADNPVFVSAAGLLGQKDMSPVSFTPGLAFGGGSTGITYTTQTGNATRIGNMVHFSLRIVLSNKGSDTGAATITNLPFTADAASDDCVYTVAIQDITLAGGYSYAIANPVSPTTTFVLAQVGSGNTIAAISDTAFTNISQLYFSGFYWTS